VILGRPPSVFAMSLVAVLMAWPIPGAALPYAHSDDELSGSRSIISVATGARSVGWSLSRPHLVTFNIRGGNGDATTGFNGDATALFSSNTVQSRIKARWPYTYAIALQEVCDNNYKQIVWELAFGYTSGTNGYRFKFVQSLNRFWNW